MKFLFARYTIKTTLYLFIISVIYFGISLIQFEKKTNNIQTLTDVFWHCAITMATVGYGDFYAKEFYGRISMIIATGFGVLFVSLFMIAWSNFIKMNSNEE